MAHLVCTLRNSRCGPAVRLAVRDRDGRGESMLKLSSSLDSAGHRRIRAHALGPIGGASSIATSHVALLSP